MKTPSQDDLAAAPIKDADLFQMTAQQDGAATDYIYNYLETRDGGVWSVVCIGRAGAVSACRVFRRQFALQHMGGVLNFPAPGTCQIAPVQRPSINTNG